MGVLDAINTRWGRGTLRLPSVPTTPEWGMRREMTSQSYTTRLDQLWTVQVAQELPEAVPFHGQLIFDPKTDFPWALMLGLVSLTPGVVRICS